jgi:hypothetical protein
VNESIADNACDTVGDLAICDDVEKNAAFTSIEQESQGDIGVADYNTSSIEQIIAENQAKDVQDEQELPGQRTHHNEIINSVGEATDGNDDPSKDPDHMIDAENTIIDEPDHTLDSMEINIVGEANETMVILVKNLMLQSMRRIATLMSVILFMTGPNQLTQLLSRQNQLLMMILIIMMYPEKNHQFNAFMLVSSQYS